LRADRENRPKIHSEGGVLGQIYNLTGLRTGYDTLQVGIFAALTLDFTLSPFSGALIAAMFLVLLLLPADSFSLAFFHAVLSELAGPALQ